MCGIGVMLGSPEKEILEEMNKFQSHRGPDGSNIWYDEFCGFSHTRLAIVDVIGSNQPIFSDSGTVLVHNGEIYNFSEIKKKNSNYSWKTKGDSETILALHHLHSKKRVGFNKINNVSKKGGILVSSGFNSRENPANFHKEWVSKLNGIWGFALWDSKRNELIISRDPMGVKPLIRTIVGNSLLVASELKTNGIRVEVDSSDNTIGKKIRTHRKMQPAYMLILGEEEEANGSVSIRARSGAQDNGIPLQDFISAIKEEISSKAAIPSLVED